MNIVQSLQTILVIMCLCITTQNFSLGIIDAARDVAKDTVRTTGDVVYDTVHNPGEIVPDTVDYTGRVVKRTAEGVVNPLEPRQEVVGESVYVEEPVDVENEQPVKRVVTTTKTVEYKD